MLSGLRRSFKSSSKSAAGTTGKVFNNKSKTLVFVHGFQGKPSMVTFHRYDYITSYCSISSSSFFTEHESFLDVPAIKYSKSSLSEERKAEIERKIRHEMESNGFYMDGTASIQVLARRIHEKPHSISEVLNEKMNNSFYDLIAFYRVEEAERIIKKD